MFAGDDEKLYTVGVIALDRDSGALWTAAAYEESAGSTVMHGVSKKCVRWP